MLSISSELGSDLRDGVVITLADTETEEVMLVGVEVAALDTLSGYSSTLSR